MGILHKNLHAFLQTEMTGWGIPSWGIPCRKFTVSHVTMWGNPL
jgi:hypothetical protein